MSTSLPSADARLTQTAAAFAQWRSSVPRPAPIPAELWAQAVELATTLGASPVARALKLDCYTLKQRMQAAYGHPVQYLETFVDPERFRGTCYRAANWQVLGLTTGRGHNARTHRPTRSRKLVLGYPLHPDFRRRLGVAP